MGGVHGSAMPETQLPSRPDVCVQEVNVGALPDVS